MSNDDRPHSRACGWIAHRHGWQCHTDCPTCHGESRPTTPDVEVVELADDGGPALGPIRMSEIQEWIMRTADEAVKAAIEHNLLTNVSIERNGFGVRLHDDAVLASVLRRLLNNPHGYVCNNPGGLTIDASVAVSEHESDVIARARSL